MMNKHYDGYLINWSPQQHSTAALPSPRHLLPRLTNMVMMMRIIATKNHVYFMVMMLRIIANKNHVYFMIMMLRIIANKNHVYFMIMMMRIIALPAKNHDPTSSTYSYGATHIY